MVPGAPRPRKPRGVRQSVDHHRAVDAVGATPRVHWRPGRRWPRSSRVRHVGRLRPRRHPIGQGRRLYRRDARRDGRDRTTQGTDSRRLGVRSVPRHSDSVAHLGHDHVVDVPRLPTRRDRTDHQAPDRGARHRRHRQAQPDAARPRRGQQHRARPARLRLRRTGAERLRRGSPVRPSDHSDRRSASFRTRSRSPFRDQAHEHAGGEQPQAMDARPDDVPVWRAAARARHRGARQAVGRAPGPVHDPRSRRCRCQCRRPEWWRRHHGQLLRRREQGQSGRHHRHGRTPRERLLRPAQARRLRALGADAQGAHQGRRRDRVHRPRRVPRRLASNGSRRRPPRHRRRSLRAHHRRRPCRGVGELPPRRQHEAPPFGRSRPGDVGVRGLQLLRDRVSQRRVLQGADSRGTRRGGRRCRPSAVHLVRRALQRVRQLPHVLSGER